QVIAAAAPMGSTSVQIGTLVKLIRVLMLGPVCLVLSPMAPRLRDKGDEFTAGDRPPPGRPALHQLVPWFVVGFLALDALLSATVMPTWTLAPIATAATGFTIISMAALGLGVDLRTVARPGGPVTI